MLTAFSLECLGEEASFDFDMDCEERCHGLCPSHPKAGNDNHSTNSAIQ